MPELSKKVLKEFTAMAKEKRIYKSSVSVKLSKKDLQAYRAFDRGYIQSNLSEFPTGSKIISKTHSIPANEF